MLLERLLERDRRLFEHWTHDASAIPTVWYPYWKPRFERYRRRVLEHPWWLERVGPDPERVFDHVLRPHRARGAADGPGLRGRAAGRDATRPGGGGSLRRRRSNTCGAPASWSSPGGRASTRSTTSPRASFRGPRRAEPQSRGAPRLGPAARPWSGWGPRPPVRSRASGTPCPWRTLRLGARRAAAAGEIAEVQVEAADGSQPRAAWAVPDWESRAAALPQAPPSIRLLAPFDPILRDRKRTQRLFGFDYRFEAFVPEAQRKHGYYVMPILEGDRLVGRFDPKLHRDRGVAGGASPLVGAGRQGDQGAAGCPRSRPRPPCPPGGCGAVGLSLPCPCPSLTVRARPCSSPEKAKGTVSGPLECWRAVNAAEGRFGTAGRDVRRGAPRTGGGRSPADPRKALVDLTVTTSE